MNRHPLVSINIRTYNSVRTLRDTLLSIQRQTYKNIEVLISDGHSKDESVQIAQSFGAVVRYADKLGDARYQNYEHSKGKYILSLDSDQILDQALVEHCVAMGEKQGLDAVTIAERSFIRKNTITERLIAYDKWLIDKTQSTDAMFGTACPRFFRKSLLDKINWPESLSIFDDTILYSHILKLGAKVGYITKPCIRHYEVTSVREVFKKFYRYGMGYFSALKQDPATIAAHSLPRVSYFSPVALKKPHYLIGLLFLYIIKVIGASLGALSSILKPREFFISLGDGFYYFLLGRELQDMVSVLDVGCGSKSPLTKIPKTFRSVGVDLFGKSIARSREAGIHDSYVESDVRKINKKFTSKSFDAVIALDLIEHLTKKEGFKLLVDMEKIARKKVIVMTPNGFYKQEPYEKNPYQIHKSGWETEDFSRLGYTVYGIRGLKQLRGEYATIRWKPWFLWGTISALSQYILIKVPSMSHQLFAVKDV